MDGADHSRTVQRPAPHRPLRLVIIDDHQMVLDGLTAMLRP